MHNASDRRSAAIVIALLFVFMLINFADKAALGLVAVPLMKELDLSADQFGVVAGTFFSLFAISGVIVGFLANRIAAKPLLGALALIWTVAQLPLALATASMPLLIACRVLLGAGEGPAYPLALHACYKWVPNGKRNIPTAIIMQGGQAGMLLAGPVVTLLTIHYGWRSAFLVLGVAGLVWMVLWQLFSKEGPPRPTRRGRPCRTAACCWTPPTSAASRSIGRRTGWSPSSSRGFRRICKTRSAIRLRRAAGCSRYSSPSIFRCRCWGPTPRKPCSGAAAVRDWRAAS